MADPLSLLIRASLLASVAILAVAILRKPVRRLGGAEAAYGLWLLVPLAMLVALAPAPPNGLSLMPRPAITAAKIAPTVFEPSAALSAQAKPATRFLSPSRPKPAKPIDPRSLALGLWTLGVAMFAAAVILRQRRYVRAMGALQPDPARQGVFRAVGPAAGPAVVGTLGAFIVLPQDFDEAFDAEERQLVLAHEQVHLARRHPLEGGLGVILLALQWFNPLAHLAYRLFRIDQELACDAAVIAAHPRQRAAYARAMFKSQGLSLSAPFACQWPDGQFESFKERLNMLMSKSPTRARRFGARLALCLVLTGGAYVAYAAEPGAPERLATQAAGVVGSGDQLSLKIRAPEGERTVKIGETYADGWTLQALTPTKATLSKDGTTREVGLNPTGAIASNTPAAPPSTVNMAGMLDEATIQRYVDAALAKDPKALDRARGIGGPFLSLDEGRRRIAVQGLLNDALDRRTGGDPAAGRTLNVADQRALLGEAAFDDYWTLDKKMADLAKAKDGADQAGRIADLAAHPVTGPTSYYAAAGVDMLQAAADQGIDRRGMWTSGPPDANGGRTFTLVAGTAEQLQARLAQPQQGPTPPPSGTPLAFTRMPTGQTVLVIPSQ
ncbi:MAG: transcriptional regulator [Caulobacteraceae bacterium]|nr:transcriptional regulator [Caulobacteraceae bacterium]